MANAMKGVTTALVTMNKRMNIPGLQKVMTEFMRENERADMTQEALGDTLDDAMAEEGSADQEDLIVNQILAELGMGIAESVPEAPKTMDESSNVVSDHKVTIASPAGSNSIEPTTNDPQLSDLEIRLNNLRKS